MMGVKRPAIFVLLFNKYLLCLVLCYGVVGYLVHFVPLLLLFYFGHPSFVIKLHRFRAVDPHEIIEILMGYVPG